MIPKSLRGFIAELLEATSDRKITWAEGAPDAYFCAHKNFNLHIRYLVDSDTGVSFLNFRIVKGGQDASFSVMSEEDDYFLMNDLYSAISVNANNFDSISEDFFGP